MRTDTLIGGPVQGEEKGKGKKKKGKCAEVTTRAKEAWEEDKQRLTFIYMLCAYIYKISFKYSVSPGY